MADAKWGDAGPADTPAAKRAVIEQRLKELNDRLLALQEELSSAEDDKVVAELTKNIQMVEGSIFKNKIDLMKLPQDDVAAALQKVEALSTAEEPAHDVVGFRTAYLEVIVEPSDPKAPIAHANTFEELHLRPELLKGIYKKGLQKPSPFQQKALPLVVTPPYVNVIGQSQTGTGKTVAISLGILARVDETKKYPQVIVVSPTRELSRDTAKATQDFAEFTDIKVIEAVPDVHATVPRGIQEQIIIGTPGTIKSWIDKRVFDLRKISIIVLDEAEQLLDEQSSSMIAEVLCKNAPPGSQLLLFSATFNDRVLKFAKRQLGNPTMITIKHELWLPNIKHYLINCNNGDHRFQVLSNLYGLFPIGQAMIFCQKKDGADRLTAQMIHDGHKVSSTHGGMSAAERDRLFSEFKAARTKVLITTNVLSRGIDVPQVNLVINYEPPLMLDDKHRKLDAVDVASYVHRSGRTGRFGRKGVVINFVHDERSRDQFAQIERLAKEKHGAPDAIRISNPDDIGELENVMKSQFSDLEDRK